MASSICDLYRCRWGIETFFKEIKQTLQIRTFVGFSRNAIEWQIWSALLTYLLMRIMAFLSDWKRDFKHFFTLMKGGTLGQTFGITYCEQIWDSRRISTVETGSVDP